MLLPPKSRYSIHEAAAYISSALSESVTSGQVLDWGAQELYKLYLSIGHATVRQEEKVSHINDCLVEIRPSTEQGAQLSRGAKITIADCWRDGERFEFVRSRRGEYGGGHTRNTLYVAVTALAVAGPELLSFLASLRATIVEAPSPAEQASATNVISGAPTQARAWQEHAQAASLKYIARYEAQNLYPTQGDVANAVEVELRTAGVVGDSGRPVSAEYIARNALRGEWWAQNKPKSRA
jgi:hypothetical protein